MLTRAVTRAVTRGNGDHGEDVTYAVRLMAEAGALPLTLTGGPRRVELAWRGNAQPHRIRHPER
ncbi:hypothetical protein GCM10009655_12570 [Rhodoglobus aureus]|uniref:Uncharacterized protein n=1 Tax=Rhodoglobus aureus TaxID=191497 RepID=A0ABP4G7X8_9MICO